jgi:aspartyl-tRNA(Asn)/glutamyl-tRNA(Gln) amidotransferase subunit B
MTIGLEIHAELKTESKMFCSCKNSGDEKSPNVNVCPVCMGHPGTLPVINKEALKKVLLVGVAVDGKLADFTEFDRKNYFYPDIPKGYQISQYKYPLVSGGAINGISLIRIHLEEDTARSTHEMPGVSLVDFNRAGVPLMELVTEPQIHSGLEASSFARELQLILQYLQVSDANMEKGEMRVEVNISVAKSDSTILGTKVEIKNINSFKAVEKAIEFEFKRQSEILEKSENVLQETRGWDENKQATFSQRTKENAHDYRYFPEPDLPKLYLSEIKEFSKEELKKLLPKLPKDKRLEYLNIGIKPDDSEFYVNNGLFREFFNETLSLQKDQKITILASNYIVSDLSGLSKTSGQGLSKITPQSFLNLIELNAKGHLSSRATKDILKIIYDSGGDPNVIAQEKNLLQKNDPTEIEEIMKGIISENQKAREDYKNGKESLLQFFVGLGMKAMKGAGNPELIQSITKRLLDSA